MFGSTPSDSSLSGFGLSSEDFEDDPVYAWPENAQATSLLSTVSSQWRAGPAGPMALDYNPLFSVMDRQGIAPADQLRLLEQIRVMEAAALSEMLKER